MKYYAGAFGDAADVPAWVARTGYTGEDGFELFCLADAVRLWEALTAAGGPACAIRPWLRLPRDARSRPACRCTATKSART